ncbi:peptidoglycan-binding protein [Sphaerisporangium sp. B11E5]|uniref:peptidoglycan-binding domain-containing protein n=1 Tax=Sphaerisporangium sp. B11E5 TaxID=3153563 RepID=UPI00325F1EAA
MTAPPYQPPPLKYPPITSGDRVRTWQQALRDRGWHIVVDGDYGKESKRLCANFQQEHRINPVDGIVGPDTWKQTWEAGSTQPQPPPPNLPLKKGDMNNEYVYKWQRQVNNRGWPELEVDSDFGKQTEDICKQMQKFKGLPVTGQIDRKTWDEAWLEKVHVPAM